MHHIIDLVLAFTQGLGYIGIFIMMTIEASFLPFPSELILIPAGHLVFLGEMNLFILIIAATLWSLAGSAVNYVLWYYLGGPIIQKFIEKYGKYVFLKIEHYKKSEEFFLKHGEISTFVGRFLPGIRSLISFPPGIFKMQLSKFVLYTVFAASLANSLLIAIWYIAGKNEELIKKMSSEILWITIVILGTIIALYIQYVKSHTKELQKLDEQIEHNLDAEVEKMETQKPKKSKKVPQKK